MGKRKSAKKKNHTSKHILTSREDDTLATSNVDGINSASSIKKKSEAKSCTKHPDEAALYLTEWKAGKSKDSSIRASTSWKFNKNTQSWLIRHMYEVEKVPKSTFLLLLEYLDGLEGKSIIDRMRIDASRRCRSHKEYCKSNSKLSTTENQEEPSGGTENVNDTITTENEEGQGGKLDDRDHEKRKQYKRARKILDLIKKSSGEKLG